MTLDIGEERNIHPAKKREMGHRLAYWALAQTYGKKGVSFTAPVFDSVELQDSTAVLKFKLTGPGLLLKKGEQTGFEIAGADSVFYPAKVQRLRGGKTLKVWNEKLLKPVAVRYCFKNWCRGTLFGLNGLPVSSFRTDDWK